MNTNNLSVSRFVRDGKKKIDPSKEGADGSGRVVAFVSADSVESVRREGLAALDLRSSIEQFVDQMETARAVYADPILRRFLDLPDEVFDAEVDIMQRAAAEQGDTVREAMRQWAELATRRNRRLQPSVEGFTNRGGAA